MFAWNKKRKKNKDINMVKRKCDEFDLEPFEISDCILPFYINTNRLTDLYAIENDGYFDSVEWTQTTTKSLTNDKEGKIEAGFKLVKFFDSSVSASISNNNGQTTQTIQNTKVVHTAASMLQNLLDDIYIEELEKYSKDIEYKQIEEGNWVCFKATLKKPLKQQKNTLIEEENTFAQRKWLRKIKKLYQSFNGIPDRAPAVLEILGKRNYKNDLERPTVSSDVILSKDYLYQCELDDLWGVELICLGKFLPIENGSRVEIVALFC